MSDSKLYALSYSYSKYSTGSRIIHSSFFLGVFSSFEKVEEAIAFYSELSGVSDDPDLFIINPISLNARLDAVYQIGISFIAEREEDDIDEILGYYESEREAKIAVKNSPFYPDFKDHFVIEQITVDKMEWREGFV